MPEGASILAKNKTLVNDIIGIKHPDIIYCFILLIRIMERLYLFNDNDWVSELVNQFKKIEFQSLEFDVSRLIQELIVAVVIGVDYSLIEPLLQRKNVDKKIRKSLGDMKNRLEAAFSGLPAICKKSTKRLLNELADITIQEADNNFKL